MERKMSDLLKLPEWKQIYQRMKNLLPEKQFFTYLELNEIAGIDVQSERGRKQFLRFRNEALWDWQVWFENMPGKGYRVIAAAEHGRASNVYRARAARRMAMACEILMNTDIAKLSPEQQAAHTHLVSCAGSIMQALTAQTKEVRTSSVAMEASIPIPDFKRLGNRPN